ncbi:MAG: caspase family protein [Rhodobacteraceae bacterium]|nr:caspase family protein [Paracoccaceae bacterium]
MLRLVAILFLSLSFPACAAQRVAMVVGNNAYPHLPASEQLHTARNDARAMAEALRKNGFKVFHGEDLNYGDFIQMLFDFTSSLGEGDLAMFFYAGHGINLAGGNYLLPSDIRPPQSTRRMEDQRMASLSIHEQHILSAMRDSGATISVAILDACRNNPIENPDGRSVGATRGLARAATMPQGTFSIYAAGYGQVALDRLPGESDRVHSVFTRVLLDKLAEPGVTLRGLALATRGEVRKLAAQAGHEQSPAYYDELGGDDPVLLTAKANGVTNPVVTDAAPFDSVDAQIELMMIDEIRSSRDPALLKAYLDTYPNGRFAAFARARLNNLRADPDPTNLSSVEMEDLKNEYEAMRRQLAQQMAERAAILDELTASKKQENVLKDQVASLSAHIDQLRLALAEALATSDSMLEENDNLAVDNAVFSAQLERMEFDLAKAREQLLNGKNAWAVEKAELEDALQAALAALAETQPGRDFLGQTQVGQDSFGTPSDTFGMTLVPRLRGMRVSAVNRKTSAYTRGIRVGDIIQEIDGVPVSRLSDVQRLVRLARQESRPAKLRYLKMGTSIAFAEIDP